MRQAALGRGQASRQAPGVAGSHFEWSSVRPATAESYMELIQEFRAWARRTDLPLSPAKCLDAALVEYSLLEEEGARRGKSLLAALAFEDPDLGRRGQGRLPQPRAALRGWRRLAPPPGRLPLPFELVAGLAHVLHGSGKPLQALAVVFVAVCYLRPSELIRLEVRNVIPPLAVGSESHVR